MRGCCNVIRSETGHGRLTHVRDDETTYTGGSRLAQKMGLSAHAMGFSNWQNGGVANERAGSIGEGRGTMTVLQAAKAAILLVVGSMVVSLVGPMLADPAASGSLGWAAYLFAPLMMCVLVSLPGFVEKVLRGGDRRR